MNKQSGQMLLEVLVSVILLGIVTVSVVPTVSFMLKRTRHSRYDTQASALLEEGMEVAYNVFLAQNDWSSYNGQYKVAQAGASWTLVPGSETNLETRFSRTIIVAPVCRDETSGQQVGSCSLPDPHSKSVTTNVSWVEAAEPKQLTAELLLYQYPR